MSVVDAVPIDVVVEQRSECSDRAEAEAALSAVLAGARAPRRSSNARAGGAWRLTMSVRAVAPGTKSADAQIRDDEGRVVAGRAVSDRTTGSCLALVHAVGAWAQIVLDDELLREQQDADRRVGTAPSPEEARPMRVTVTIDRPTDSGELGSSDRNASSGRTFEVGTVLFLRNGVAATGGMFGVAPFVTVSFAETWVLRPSMMYGTSTSRVRSSPSSNDNLFLLGGRLDVCRRMPGNYVERRGIEFDACLGGDAAHVWSARDSALRGSVGPSAVLRGELGRDFGLEIRAMVGVNLNRGAFEELPPLVAATELGGSVRFR